MYCGHGLPLFMCTRAKQQVAVSDRARRENVPRHILFKFYKQEKEDRRKMDGTFFLLAGGLLIILFAVIVAVVALLKDNPVVLVNILYMLGIVAAIWIWKNPGKK